MAFRGREMMKNIAKKLGEKKYPKTPLKESYVPDSKIVMNRAKRGLFAGKHIRFGNLVSEDGGNKSRRTWKPNVQEKRLFSYILDRHIRVKVTTHALRCIDKAGGIDEYLLRTPYQKMDTEVGLFWKAKVEKLYEELGNTEVLFFSPEDEAKFEEEFEEMKLEERAIRGEARRLLNVSADKRKEAKGPSNDEVVVDDDAAKELVPGHDKKYPYPGKGAVIFNF